MHDVAFQNAGISPLQIDRAFRASNSITFREEQELAQCGHPIAARDGSALVRANTVAFDGLRFRFEPPGIFFGGGVRAFLFRVVDDCGETRDIIAWAPMINRIGSLTGAALKYDTGVFNSEHDDSVPDLRMPLEWLIPELHSRRGSKVTAVLQ